MPRPPEGRSRASNRLNTLECVSYTEIRDNLLRMRLLREEGWGGANLSNFNKTKGEKSVYQLRDKNQLNALGLGLRQHRP